VGVAGALILSMAALLLFWTYYFREPIGALVK